MQDGVQRALGRIEGKLDEHTHDIKEVKEWQANHDSNDHGRHRLRELRDRGGYTVGGGAVVYAIAKALEYLG